MKTTLISLPALLLIAALLFITGCDPYKPERVLDHSTVHISYRYEYKGSVDSTFIDATVMVEYYGEPGVYFDADLWPGESITFNGDTLRPVYYGGGWYQLAVPGMADSGTFTYNSFQHISYPYTMPPVTPRTLPAGFTSINLHAVDTLHWDGGPIAYNERVSLNVHYIWNNNPFESAPLSSYDKPYILLDGPHIFDVPTGTDSVYLTYFTHVGSETLGAPQGCSIDRRLYSPERAITVY
jgi:hypothetical protein